jgi:hypothetical protein
VILLNRGRELRDRTADLNDSTNNEQKGQEKLPDNVLEEDCVPYENRIQ